MDGEWDEGERYTRCFEIACTQKKFFPPAINKEYILFIIDNYCMVFRNRVHARKFKYLVEPFLVSKRKHEIYRNQNLKILLRARVKLFSAFEVRASERVFKQFIEASDLISILLQEDCWERVRKASFGGNLGILALRRNIICELR